MAYVQQTNIPRATRALRDVSKIKSGRNVSRLGLLHRVTRRHTSPPPPEEADAQKLRLYGLLDRYKCNQAACVSWEK